MNLIGGGKTKAREEGCAKRKPINSGGGLNKMKAEALTAYLLVCSRVSLKT